MSPDTMHCLNGIRAISAMWVVVGHTILMFMVLPSRNELDSFMFPKHFYNIIVLSAEMSVNSFLVMSGLLVSINMLKHLEKT